MSSESETEREKLARIDTDKYPDGPDDERLMHFSKRELRHIVWAYGCELRGLKKDSTHTDAYTLAEVKRLRKGIQHALHIRLKHGQEEGWKELKELIELG